MYKFTPYIAYKINGVEKNFVGLTNEDLKVELALTDDSIKAILHPLKELELINFKLDSYRSLDDEEWFFVNGFQSWSTSLEVQKNDKLSGVTPLSKISGFTHHIASMSGDYLFADDYGKKGKFHSFSYTYFRLNNKIEFFGSMNERTGYTIFELNANQGRFAIRKDVLGVITDKDYELLDIMILSGDYDDCFDKYFFSMNLRKPKINHLSGYTSWYNYFQKIDENIIIRDLNGLDIVKEDVSIFQIDDGYETFVGDWLEVDKEKFPNGMKYCADKIHEKGYLAGIWIAPYSCQRASKVAKEHPDWLLKDDKGDPMWGCFAWNGAYILDMYNNEVREYIKNFFNVILNDWGYDMVKLDFLYSQAIYPRNGKSRGQIMCEAMDFLRECVGEEKLILGCGVPLAPSFGVVDACRITCDVDLAYKGKFYNALGVNREVPSAQNSMTNTVFRRHLNQRVFVSDPDVFFLREDNLSFTDTQKYILGRINHLFGDVLFVSDNVADYGEREIDYVREFFAESEAVIKSAEFKDNIMTIDYTENGKEHIFKYDMGKGLLRDFTY